MAAEPGPHRHERRFRAMGSAAHVLVLGGRGGLLEAACDRVADLERRWSRFLPDSEISRLNRAAGRPMRVSAETYDLIERSVTAAHLTAGRFDPTVGAAVEAAGYDRNFADLPADRPSPGVDPGALTGPGAEAIALDAATCRVGLPPNTQFDPGGIGKGFGADLVANELLACGADGAMVSLGGDLVTVGEGPDEGSWVIDIDHPEADQPPLAHLAVGQVAVATSSRLRRHWRVDGQERHHLIDPATGRTARSPFDTVSVLAGEGWWAEAQAKATFVAGDLSVLVGASGLALWPDGTIHCTPELTPVVTGA